jgi:hypothetical protein
MRAAHATAFVVGAFVACTSYSSHDADDAGAPDAGSPPSDAAVEASCEGSSCDACGHDCLGGECVAGKCMPFVLAKSDEGSVSDLVVDATRVIWMTNGSEVAAALGSLFVCAKDGCNGAPTRIVSSKSMGTVASDGTTAYASFVNGDHAIVRIDAAGTTSKLPLSHFEALVMQQRSDGLNVMGFYEPDGGMTQRALYLYDGTKEGLFATFDSPPAANIRTMFVTDTHVFIGANNMAYLASCTKDGCTSWTTVSSDDRSAFVTTMTSDGKRLYWVLLDTVYSCPAVGAPCDVKQELGSDVGAIRVTFAAGDLYVETKSGDLLACDPTACQSSLRPLVHGESFDQFNLSFGHTVAADDRAIYYAATNGTGTRIMKLAK